MNKTAIIYWSGTGNTELMAQAIQKGIASKAIEVDIFSVSDISAKDLTGYTAFAFGCPSMGCEVLEESEFEPFFTDIEGSLTDKKVLLFGSYGWGDGEWMRNWKERIKADGAILFAEGLTINGTPDDTALEQCEAFGADFATAL